MVFVFHRVDDRFSGDHLSSSRKQFRDWISYISERFEVVPLSEFVEKLRQRCGVGGLAAITFDDGYLDNHANAAPERTSLLLYYNEFYRVTSYPLVGS
jgi:hypothetical protein